MTLPPVYPLTSLEIFDQILKELLENIDNNENVEKISDWYFG
jgi:hypothetical protein